MFFQDGDTLQIVTAAIISLIFIVVYGCAEPFLEVSDDRLATFAQLATFVQLFAAILFAEGIYEGIPGGAAILGVAMVRTHYVSHIAMNSNLFGAQVILNTSVVLFNLLSNFTAALGDDAIHAELGDILEEFSDFAAPCLVAVGVVAATRKRTGARRQDSRTSLDLAIETMGVRDKVSLELVEHRLHVLANEVQAKQQSCVQPPATTELQIEADVGPGTVTSDAVTHEYEDDQPNMSREI